MAVFKMQEEWNNNWLLGTRWDNLNETTTGYYLEPL